MSIGFANNYTHLHLVQDDKGQWLYLGQGISTIEWENEDETDDTAYYNSGGAQPEDVIGVKVGATVSGHRYYGDAAQDYIASLVTKIGDGRVTQLRRIDPSGAVLEGPVTIKDIVDGGGEANEKGTFEFGFTYREMPKFTPPQSEDMPETISFDGAPLTVAAGETLDLATKVKVTPEGATPNCVFALDDDSLDEAKATLDAAGILTALSEGTVKVTAKCVSKPSATATAEITISAAASAGKDTPQSQVKVTAKTDGSYLGVNYADLGTFQFDGLKVTGTAKQATAQGWNGEGQDKTGYFLGFHTDNCKLLKTAKHPDGKAPDGTGDWLLLLGEESPTLTWFEVEDTAGKSDRYTVSVTTAGKVRATKLQPIAVAVAID